jgi:peroxiredoxin (alkyl hydroperoxide reductase subunit C)
MSVLVGRKAPNFVASAVMPDNSINDRFDLQQYLGGKIGVLFFYPLNFTFVCPSEIIAFNKRLEEFESKNVKVVSVSIDSPFSHIAYKNTPIEKGGIGNVQFPMVSDLTKHISQDYDVLHNNSVSYRGTFLIDQKFTVRHQSINDLQLGRSIEEVLRMVDALQHHQKYGEVCPANWNSQKKGMKPTKEGVATYLSENAENL